MERLQKTAVRLILALALSGLGWVVWTAWHETGKKSVFAEFWDDREMTPVALHRSGLLLMLAGACLFGLFCLLRRWRGVTFRAWMPAVPAGTAMVLRVFWVRRVTAVPLYDFDTYHSFASHFYEPGYFSGNNYVASFPHTLGLPAVLAPLYALFGSRVVVAQLLNVMLAGCVALVLFFLLCRAGGPVAGLAGGMLYALWPSQVFYSSLVVTEFLFLLLFCGALLAALKAGLDDGQVIRPGWAALSGLLLVLMHSVRPLTPVVLTALGLMLMLTGLRPGQSRRQRLQLGVSVVLMAGIVVVGNAGVRTLISRQVIHKPVAASAMGYTLLVGGNLDARGTWNSEDAVLWDRLAGRRDLTAPQVQDFLSVKARERYAANGEENLQLFADKMKIFWLTDHESMGYIAAGQRQKTGETTPQMKRVYLPASRLATGAWWVMLGCAFCGLLFSLTRRRIPPVVVLAALLMLGVSAMHMVTEVAGRYHVPVIPALIVCAVAPLAGMAGEKDRASG